MIKDTSAQDVQVKAPISYKKYAIITAIVFIVLSTIAYIFFTSHSAKSSIRHNLGKRIEMRRVPDIIFKDDIVLDKGLSVLKLLDEIKNSNEENNNLEDKDASS